MISTFTMPGGQVLKYKIAVPRKRRPKYNHPKQQSMSVRILNLIEERGGMTGGQIKRTLWEWAHPGETYVAKRDRNWWSTNLYGGRHPGLLGKFCEKKGNRWMRNSVSHEDQPWAVIRRRNTWSSNWSNGQMVMSWGHTPSPIIVSPGVI